MSRETYYSDNLIAGNEYPSYARVQVIKQGGEYKRGTLLGKDGDDKFLPSIATADDGSEEPRGILAEDVDTTDGDVSALVYESGVFNSNSVVFGDGHTKDSVQYLPYMQNIKIV